MSAHALIVEDDPFSAEVLQSLLDAISVSSTTITDPRNLPDVLARLEHLDMIFLDLEMPNLNGYEVMEALRDVFDINGIPVIACTVHTNEINMAQKMGFHSFLSKPLRPNLFPNQIQRILSGEPVWEVS